jgi:hypothetical protein
VPKKEAPRRTLEKRLRTGVKKETLRVNPKDWVPDPIIQHRMDMQRLIIRCYLLVMIVCVSAFLVALFLWGFGFMPNMDKDMLKWFGGGTVALLAPGLIKILIGIFFKQEPAKLRD